MNQIKKKICLVIPSLQAGGMERVMSELATDFSYRTEFEVHLVLYGISRQTFFTVPENVIIYKPDFGFNNEKRLVNTVRTLFFLRKTIKSIKPHTILNFGEYWNSFVLIALFGLKFPIYVSDRCQPNKSLGKVHDLLRKILYPKATGIIAQTEKAKDIYKGLKLNKNIEIIGNPIREIHLSNGIEKENVVLTIGRLISSKHHDKLIELFLNIGNSNWKLVIVGYDHLKQKNSEKLRQIISDNNAQERVILAGKQNDVESYYLKSKIFAFTSSSEGFPNVIGEAMSAGLPVVAFDCIAGPSDMITDGVNGYLIPLFDFDAFQKKLEKLMDYEYLRNELGVKAKESIKRFTIPEISKKTLDFILSGK
ncbi:MAG: glycosyltransferase [Marinilabiliaceae bacterium]|nr:glycosyltransferase [Marinilabiliaceae bacterium]